METDSPEPSPTKQLTNIPTGHLLLYLVIIYAWLATVALIAARWFFPGLIPWYTRILAVAVSTGLTWWGGRVMGANMERMFESRGKIALTGGQSLIITVAIVGTVFLITFIGSWLQD